MESVLSKFIPDFNLENLERDKEISKSLIMTLIEEKISISSSPFLCLMLEYYLKNNDKIKNKLILIGERESLNYYSSIGRKLGINLLKKDNDFVFVDINGAYSKLIKTQLPLEENVPDSYNQVKKGNDEYIECDKKLLKNNDMNEFYNNTFDKIKEIIKNTKEKENDKDKKYIVIFDKINDESLKALDNFMKYCFENEINLIFSINNELNSDKTGNYFDYLSDIIIKIKSNESGFSKDISGILDIIIKKEFNNEIKSFRYNLKTNDIKIFNHIEI
jgi:hypothetical protein